MSVDPNHSTTSTGSRTSLVALAAVALVMAAGCGRPMLTVSDAIVIGGCQTPIDAYAEHVSPLGDLDQLLGVPVTFSAGGKDLGTSLTDRRGFARHCCHLHEHVDEVEARATIDGQMVAARGRVFEWKPDRPIIVCDIDETISATNYGTLLDDHEEDTGSLPLDGAAQTLRRLSERFHIIYMTARPRPLFEKTKRWVRRHGFPDAPIVTAPTLAEAIGVEKFKGQAIAEYQAVADNILLGIGNANTDSEAYAANGLLAILLDMGDTNHFRAHAVVLSDWKAIDRFFEANREMLQSPAKIRAVIAGEELILRPIVPWWPKGP